MKIQRDRNAYNGKSSSFFALPVFLACTTMFKGIIMLTNIHFPLTYFGAGSSLRLLWSLPALFSLPFYVKEGPKISRCHFCLTNTCLPASSRWLRREGPPSLLSAQSRMSQSYPLLCLDQMRKTKMIGTFSEKCIFAGTRCLTKPFHEDTINSPFFFFFCQSSILLSILI